MFKEKLKFMFRSPSLSEALPVVYRMTGNRTKTNLWYRVPVNHLINLVGDIPVGDVTPEMIPEWSAHIRKMKAKGRQRPLSPRSISTYLSAMRAFWNRMIELGYVKESPARYMKVPKPPRSNPKSLPPEVIDKLMRVAKRHPRDYAMLWIAADTGCRRGGLASMRISRMNIYEVEEDGVTFLEGTALVNEKGDKYRDIYFGHDACKALWAYLQTREDSPFDELWLSQLGTPLTSDGLYQIMKRLRKRAGIERATWHSLRHTYAKRLIKAGVDMKAVADLMGHEDPSFTLKQYVGYTVEELKQINRQKGRYKRKDKERSPLSQLFEDFDPDRLDDLESPV